jgi:hypothetical protein
VQTAASGCALAVAPARAAADGGESSSTLPSITVTGDQPAAAQAAAPQAGDARRGEPSGDARRGEPSADARAPSGQPASQDPRARDAARADSYRRFHAGRIGLHGAIGGGIASEVLAGAFDAGVAFRTRSFVLDLDVMYGTFAPLAAFAPGPFSMSETRWYLTPIAFVQAVRDRVRLQAGGGVGLLLRQPAGVASDAWDVRPSVRLASVVAFNAAPGVDVLVRLDVGLPGDLASNTGPQFAGMVGVEGRLLQ